MSMNGIPTGAATFRVVREKRVIRGRSTRICTLVCTTHDGFVGESVPRCGRFDHRAAYEQAVAARASALYAAQQREMNRLPVAGARVEKPAPAAQMLTALKDSLLFSEVERRGYEVAIP